MKFIYVYSTSIVTVYRIFDGTYIFIIKLFLNQINYFKPAYSIALVVKEDCFVKDKFDFNLYVLFTYNIIMVL